MNTIILDIPIIPAIKVPIPTKVTIIWRALANCIDLSSSSATFLTLIPLGSEGSTDFLFFRKDFTSFDSLTAPDPPILWSKVKAKLPITSVPFKICCLVV